MDTGPTRTNSLVASLGTISEARLQVLSADRVAKVVRRVVDHDAVAPKLDVAAFNSSV